MKKHFTALLALLLALAALTACGKRKIPLDEYLIANAVALSEKIERPAEVPDEILPLVAPYSSRGTPERALVIGAKPEDLEDFASGIFEEDIDFDALPDSLRRETSSALISLNNGTLGLNYLAAAGALSADETYRTHKDFSGVYYVVLYYGDTNALVVVFSETTLPEVIGAAASPLFLTADMESAAGGNMPAEFEEIIDTYNLTVTEYDSPAIGKMLK
ncbi:MAG: hypothetical protein LBN99_08445 [Oscillospiraceae bacterium]|nr:hypothetical protein [Oscillospiraceae bacterium]